jgi:hypothetical protein
MPFEVMKALALASDVQVTTKAGLSSPALRLTGKPSDLLTTANMIRLLSSKFPLRETPLRTTAVGTILIAGV